MFRRSRWSSCSSCWPPYAPPARAQVYASPTMLFHVLVLLHLLPSGGHSACVRSLLNTDEEPGKQQGRKLRLEWLRVWRFAAHFYPHRVHVSQHQHPFFFSFFFFVVVICSVRGGGGRQLVPEAPSAVQPVRLWDVRSRESGEGVLWRGLQLRGGEGGLWKHPANSSVTIFSYFPYWTH